MAQTITQAASDGSIRDLLVAMRGRIAMAVESQATSARDLASLSKRLVDIVREIEAIDARELEELSGQASDEEWSAV